MLLFVRRLDAAATAANIAWQEATSQHFRIFYMPDAAYTAEDAAFVQDVLTYAEHYYEHIALGLGITHVIKRDHVPWLGDKRCRIYLYADKAAYVAIQGVPAWASGSANYRQREVYSFLGAAAFLNDILPHELAHIVFREYVGFHNAHVPRWLDEGVAQYASIDRVERTMTLMQRWMNQDTYIPLTDLTRLPIEHAENDTVRLFYVQAATLVHFFLDTYGTRRFIYLCNSLRDGHDLEHALRFATAGDIRSLGDLEEEWYAFLLRAP